MAVLDDLASYMQTNGLGTVGVDIFKGGLQVQPPDQYALIDSGGAGPIRELDNVSTVDQPAVQVLSRSAAYQVASTKAMQAYLLFDAILEQQIGAQHYKVVEPQQPPFLLNRESRLDSSHEGYILAFNVRIEVER